MRYAYLDGRIKARTRPARPDPVRDRLHRRAALDLGGRQRRTRLSHSCGSAQRCCSPPRWAWLWRRSSTNIPDAGGLYAWAREDFGPWHGFLCFWIYWFSIALTLPGSAMFAMSMSAYALGPQYAYLADNQTLRRGRDARLHLDRLWAPTSSG